MTTNSRRVLFLTPSVRMLGARQSLLQLARGLDRTRYEPVVVCPTPGPLSEELAKAGVEVEFVRMRPWRKGRSWPFIPFTVAKLRKIARERSIDLVHANEPHAAPYAVQAAMGRPVAAHVRLESSPAFAKKYHLTRVDKLWCVSEAVRDTLFAGGNPAALERNDALVVYNGLDLAGFAAEAGPRDEARREVREKIGASPDDFILGQYGLLSARKRHRDVFAALRRWSDQDALAASRAIYLVIGDEGPRDAGFADSLRADAASHGLRVHPPGESPNGADAGVTPRPRVVFLGFMPSVARHYAAADAIVLPSDQEGFGRVIVEAAAFGLPSIGSRVGGIPEVIEEGRTGWLCAPGGVEELAAAIASAATDPAERARRGDAALDRAKARFSLAAHAARAQDIYDEMLAVRAARLV
jgi:glycosyltransferase involved in cell wall biosynthesis